MVAMIWLSTSTVSRLRDQLRTRGQRPSVVLPAPGSSPEENELVAVMAEYGPLCEAMYLMMSADGDVTQVEREVLKGALRNLSGDTLRGAQIEAMLEASARMVAAEGRDARLAHVIAALSGDEARAEVTFVLAAAVAFADNAIADEENETLNALAEGLGIDDVRANQLLDSVEQDLSAQS